MRGESTVFSQRLAQVKHEAEIGLVAHSHELAELMILGRLDPGEALRLDYALTHY